jgi:hypothetical protein
MSGAVRTRSEAQARHSRVIHLGCEGLSAMRVGGVRAAAAPVRQALSGHRVVFQFGARRRCNSLVYRLPMSQAKRTHPVAQFSRAERRRLDVEPLLHQASDLIARVDHITDYPAKHADALVREHRRHRYDQRTRADLARDHPMSR